MSVINNQHTDTDDIRRDAKAIYDGALAAFNDRSFAEVFLIVKYLVHEDTFDRAKPIIEKQIGRKLRFEEPIGQANFVDAWKNLYRHMPRSRRSTVVPLRRH